MVLSRYFLRLRYLIHRTKLLPKTGDKLVELFENFQDMAIEETPDGLTFIHLEKSIVVNDSSGNLLAPSYWRLKIDTIDGFMLGMPQSMVET